MIVNVGKRVHVKCGEYTISRDADTPGVAQVAHRARGDITLPGNTEDAKHFVEAYLRCVNEPVEYRETAVE